MASERSLSVSKVFEDEEVVILENKRYPKKRIKVTRKASDPQSDYHRWLRRHISEEEEIGDVISTNKLSHLGRIVAPHKYLPTPLSPKPITLECSLNSMHVEIGCMTAEGRRLFVGFSGEVHVMDVEYFDIKAVYTTEASMRTRAIVVKRSKTGFIVIGEHSLYEFDFNHYTPRSTYKAGVRFRFVLDTDPVWIIDENNDLHNIEPDFSTPRIQYQTTIRMRIDCKIQNAQELDYTDRFGEDNKRLVLITYRDYFAILNIAKVKSHKVIEVLYKAKMFGFGQNPQIIAVALNTHIYFVDVKARTEIAQGDSNLYALSLNDLDTFGMTRVMTEGDFVLDLKVSGRYLILIRKGYEDHLGTSKYAEIYDGIYNRISFTRMLYRVQYRLPMEVIQIFNESIVIACKWKPYCAKVVTQPLPERHKGCNACLHLYGLLDKEKPYQFLCTHYFY